MTLTHEFVEYIPETLRGGVVYVSVAFATVAHRCCCGCGKEVVTPLSPTDWKLIFDGETVSLDPSIGNWSFECRSHYFIRRSRVQWAGQWSQEQIEAGRRRERADKERYFEKPAATDAIEPEQSKATVSDNRASGIWQRLKKRWSQLTRRP